MELSFNTRRALLGVALSIGLAAGCGGGGASGPAGPQEVRGWSNPFGSAAVVLGQAGFDQVNPQGTGATPILRPAGSPAVVQDGRLFVGSGRQLLGFARFDAANGPVAGLTYDLFQALQAEVPGGLSARGAKLVLAAGHQVHIFDGAPQAPSEAPDVSSPNLLSGCDASHLNQPRSAFLTPLGQLVVADTFNNRVLVWSTVPQTGDLPEPDLVLGQRSMDKCAPNDDDGDGNTDAASARTMSHPSSVWSDDVRLVVADYRNHRVLLWNRFPSAADPDSHRASVALGQANLGSVGANAGKGRPSADTLAFPSSVDVSEAGELAVADSNNNRVLIWRTFPTAHAQAAALVVGQGDFEHGHANDVGQAGQQGTVPSAKTLSEPVGARFHGRNLIVNDRGNDRVLIWREKD